MTIHTAIKLPAQNLGPKAFAPYGEIIRPRTSSAETAVEEPKLTLTNGTPRLWIMDLRRRGLVFADMARHRRVSQCLGSMQGKEWFIGVAPPNDLADGIRPELERIAAFRIPGDCLIKLHVGTWHAARTSSMTSACFSIWKISTPTSETSTRPTCPTNIKFKHSGADARVSHSC